MERLNNLQLDPNNIDGQAIMSMFKSLHQSIKTVRLEIAQTNAGLESKIQSIILAQHEDDDRIINLGEKQEQTEERVIYLTGVVARQEKMISSLNDKIVEMERRRLIDNVIMSVP